MKTFYQEQKLTKEKQYITYTALKTTVKPPVNEEEEEKRITKKICYRFNIEDFTCINMDTKASLVYFPSCFANYLSEITLQKKKYPFLGFSYSEELFLPSFGAIFGEFWNEGKKKSLHFCKEALSDTLQTFEKYFALKNKMDRKVAYDEGVFDTKDKWIFYYDFNETRLYASILEYIVKNFKYLKQGKIDNYSAWKAFCSARNYLKPTQVHNVEYNVPILFFEYCTILTNKFLAKYNLNYNETTEFILLIILSRIVLTNLSERVSQRIFDFIFSGDDTKLFEFFNKIINNASFKRFLQSMITVAKSNYNYFGTSDNLEDYQISYFLFITNTLSFLFRIYEKSPFSIDKDLNRQTVALIETTFLPSEDNERIYERNEQRGREIFKNLETKNYTIVFPTCKKDIIEEGFSQKNCVGGYEHFLEEDNKIVGFIRRKDNLEKSLVTFDIYYPSLTRFSESGIRNATNTIVNLQNNLAFPLEEQRVIHLNQFLLKGNKRLIPYAKETDMPKEQLKELSYLQILMNGLIAIKIIKECIQKSEKMKEQVRDCFKEAHSENIYQELLKSIAIEKKEKEEV